MARVVLGRQRVTFGGGTAARNYTQNVRAQFKTITDNLTKVIAAIENATPEAIVHGMQPMFDKSQVYVPFDTGALSASGYLVAQKSSRGVQAEIGYGKGGTPHYTVLVHESVEIPHREPTRSKFLQAAINEHIDEVFPRAVEFIRQETGLG